MILRSRTTRPRRRPRPARLLTLGGLLLAVAAGAQPQPLTAWPWLTSAGEMADASRESDPFLVPLPRTQVTVRAGYADLYRPGGLEQTGASHHRELGLAVRHLRVHRPGVLVSLAATSRLIGSRVDTNPAQPAQDILLTHDRRLGRVGMGLHTGDITLDTRLTLLDRGDAPLPGIDVTARPWPEWRVTGGWERRHPRLYASMERGVDLAELAVDAPGEDMYTGLAWTVQPGLVWTATWRRMAWDGSGRGSLIPTLFPDGEARTSLTGLEVERGEWRLRGALRLTSVSGTATGRKGELVFAHISTLDLDGVSGSIGVGYRWEEVGVSLDGELEAGVLLGEARGHVEVWPWTSGWVDYLGLRRYFIATLDAEILRAGVQAQWPMGREVTLTGGLQGIDVIPRATFDHWRPAVLVFGKEDEQHVPLVVSRFSGALLDLGVEWTRGAMTVGYRFQQLLPLRVERTVAEEEPAPPDTDPPPPQPGPPSTEPGPAYGGGVHRLTLRWTVH